MIVYCSITQGADHPLDVDRSGSISLREFEDALVAFGYRLSPQFVQLLFGTYARAHSRGRGDEGERERVLSFDLFVQACISLKRSTDVFKKVRRLLFDGRPALIATLSPIPVVVVSPKLTTKQYDSDRDGYITLSL